MNLYLCLLSQPAPSANYRGESEQNRSVIQKITIGQNEYPVISPEAIRNALRDMLQGYGLEVNREREHNDDQLAVRFKSVPWPEKYIDDFYFGYLVASKKDAEKVLDKERNGSFRYKRDSVIRNNLAIGLTPYRYETIFTQSPKHTADSPWKNAGSSQLLHREITHTQYQYPVALNLDDCKIDPSKPEDQYNIWFSYILQALTELSGVAGNHARSYFEMAPVSAITRLTPRLASGFPLYSFYEDGQTPAVVSSILAGDLPGPEFHLAGEFIRKTDPDIIEQLKSKGVNVYRTTDALFSHLSNKLCGRSLPLIKVPS